jgi:hypothetical protein
MYGEAQPNVATHPELTISAIRQRPDGQNVDSGLRPKQNSLRRPIH